MNNGVVSKLGPSSYGFMVEGKRFPFLNGQKLRYQNLTHQPSDPVSCAGSAVPSALGLAVMGLAVGALEVEELQPCCSRWMGSRSNGISIQLIPRRSCCLSRLLGRLKRWRWDWEIFDWWGQTLKGRTGQNMFELGVLNFWAEASAGNKISGARFHLFDKVSKVPASAHWS
jgi:hypothetical protein